MSEAVYKLLQSAWQIAGKIERPYARCINYIEIAETYWTQGDQPQYLSALAEALKVADSLKRPEEKSRMLGWIARVYMEAGESSRAEELFNRAILLARAAETTALKVNALYNLACEYTDIGLAASVESILSELHDTVIAPGEDLDVACELVNIAEIWADLMNLSRSAATLEEALKAAESLTDHWFLAERLLEIAGIYIDLEQKEKGLTVLGAALQNVSQIDEMNRPDFLAQIAEVYHSAGNQNEAGGLLTTALGIVNRDEPGYAKSKAWLDLAEGYLQSGYKDEAIGIINQAVENVGAIEDLKDKVSILIGAAGLQGKFDPTGKALETAQKAFNLCGKLADKKSQIFSLGNIALMYVGLHQPDKANEAVKAIESIVLETGVKTSGLGVLAGDMAKAGEIALAWRLARIIRENDTRVSALISIARNLAESGAEPDESVSTFIQEIAG